ELTKEEIDKYIDELYSCFPTGREFEIFLNSFLSALGFEEVVTTQYVGDKGIDLTCTKTGLDIQNGTDTINYYVQAKRYARSNKVQPKEVRDLKGTTKRDKNGNILNSNYINVFITTSTFTKAALEEANDNPNMPVITIDGTQLIQYCVEHAIGFNYKPVFSKNDIISLTQCGQPTENFVVSESEYLVEREITKNDIRARILIIPQVIKNELSIDKETFNVVFNGLNKQLNIDKSRRYFGGVTDLYKQFGLLTSDGIFINKKAKWKIDNNKIVVDLI
ncbi:MAG: restriction endonuclease, partial [Alphaproteobacteria bacterium]